LMLCSTQPNTLHEEDGAKSHPGEAIRAILKVNHAEEQMD
jgi:hypothetical protein